MHMVMRAVLAAEIADAGLHGGQDRDLWLLIHGCRLTCPGRRRPTRPDLTRHVRGRVARQEGADQVVESPALIDDLAYHPSAVVGHADAALVHSGPPVRELGGPRGPGLPGPLRAVPVTVRASRAVVSQALRDSAPDSGSAAGTQGNPAGEPTRPGLMGLVVRDCHDGVLESGYTRRARGTGHPQPSRVQGRIVAAGVYGSETQFLERLVIATAGD